MEWCVLLVAKGGKLRVLYNRARDRYCLSLLTEEDMEWRPISKALYDLLVLELGNTENH